MKIKNIHLLEFKRFKDLKIQNVPESAKLVILAGPNGCGKSSLFDAFISWRHMKGQFGVSYEGLYYKRTIAAPHINLSKEIEIDFYKQPSSQDEIRKAFYVRSAYRNDPDVTVTGLQKQARSQDEARFHRMIDHDATVSKNYSSLMGRALNGFIRNRDATSQEIIGGIFDRINNILTNVFGGDLTLTDLGDPTEGGTFYFTKGTSVNFHYKNLSGGEKAAFDLVLDFIIKTEVYRDSVYCIDEPETHLNTRVQAKLLVELLQILPDTCQLWISTHSIGMMRAARDLWDAESEKVCFLNFEGCDFDAPQVIEPLIPTRKFWESVLKVALDDISSLVAPQNIVICEGAPRLTPSAGANADHDAQCYNVIFGTSKPDTLFISGGSASEVISDHYVLVAGITSVVGGVAIRRVVDRDARDTETVAELQKKGVRVLSTRHLEGYLWSPEVLEKLCVSVGKPEQAAHLLAFRDVQVEKLKAAGSPEDDIKSISGLLYVETCKVLSLHNHGNTARSFMRANLAPLVSPDTKVYQVLEQDIFGA